MSSTTDACRFCGRVASPRALGVHIRRGHGMTAEEYWLRFLGQPPLCAMLGCTNLPAFRSIPEGYLRYCSERCRSKAPFADSWERFWSQVMLDLGCWLWTGHTDRNGYGVFNFGVGDWLAHRVAYCALVGPIPPSLELDHLCRRPPCVNPWHLEAVTHRENMLRGLTNVAAVHAAMVLCSRGHDQLVVVRRKRGLRRECVTCKALAAHHEIVRRFRLRTGH